MKRKFNSMWRVVIVAVMVVSLGLVMAVPVSAAVTVAPASGGEAISADTAADATVTSPAWTDLGAITTMTITEGAVADIAVQTDATLVLKAPSGFQFNDAQTPSISWVGADITALALTSITASEITVTLTATGIVTMDSITIGAAPTIQVQPTTGHLPADGQIYRPTTGGGDAVIDGIITTNEADGDLGGTATNFGILGMVHGALNAYTVEAASPQVAGTPFTVTITAVDQFENTATGIDGTLNGYTFTFSGPANAPDDTTPTYPTAPSFGSGVWSPSVTLVKAETVPLTVTDSQATPMSGISDPITVDPGSATLLVVSGITDPFIAGGTSGVTVEALDSYGNRATGYTGEIHFTSSDTRANVVLPADYTFILADDGIKVFDGTTEGEIVRLVTKGEQTVTATDTALTYITGTQADITVQVVTRPPPRIAPPVIETNLFGEVSTFSISETGEILETITATSVDGNLTITIPEGIIALDEAGNPLGTLEAGIDESPPPPPEDAYIIGLAYNFGPAGVTFDPQITFEYTYDPAEIPEGVAEEDLVIAYYDEEAGEWVECECTCDPETDCVTASVCHFTCFAIIAVSVPPPPPPPPTPAAFTSSSLSISPVEVDIGEAVSISALVTNTGEEVGSYTITLKINGVVEETKEISLAGGTSKTITFTTAKDKAGTYSVDVDGLMGSFMVKAALPPPAPPPTAPPPPTPPPGVNWAILGPIIAVAVFLAIFLPVRIRRRRASR